MSDVPDSTLDRFRTVSSDDLAATYRELGGLLRAVQAQRLQILRVLDEREAWRADGCASAAQWVAATDMVPTGTARALVATAEHLEALPAVTAAAEAGRLSMAQLVPIAELADTDSDERWAAEGPSTSPAALEQLARQKRQVSRDEALRQRGRRDLRFWNDRHGLGMRLGGLVPVEIGEMIRSAIDRRAEAMPKNEQGGYDPIGMRRADALGELCAADSTASGRPEIVVHLPVGVAKLAPTLPDGTPMSLDVVRRLACDSTVRLLFENPDGIVAGYGRRRRIVPDKMRARLAERARGHCEWNGCEHTRGLKAHHIAEWVAHGGGTEEANCILLCPMHHHLVHEGGWTITGDPTGEVRFHRPACGTALPTAPTAADPDLLAHYGLDAA